MSAYPKSPYREQEQIPPGPSASVQPVPDHGEHSYRGNGRLKGKRALITGGDGGIGRAVAIAYARGGADILISYLEEVRNAKDVPPDRVTKFGENTPMTRAGQPVELATAYVMLADPLSSYVSGPTIAVTGGRPFL